jgi:hypothetical protein
MSLSKQLTILIESLEKREFDKIVKIYLQKEYNYKSIVFTDGKNDTGIDVKVFDFESQNIQYQLTTQRSTTKSEQSSFEKKLLEDLEKARINTIEYNYKDKLIYFYSKTLTNEKIRSYVKLAFKDYKINLEIIDANRLAEESENIFEIQKELYQISELDKFRINNSQFENNLFYDLLSFGKPTEFKTQVIESFILQHFFLQENISKDNIIKSCEQKFSVKENEIFYDRLLSKFQTEKRIIKDKVTQNYSLTADERNLLKKKNEQYELDKSIFFNGVFSLLKPHSQEQHIDEYITELKQLYIENFNTDLTDVLMNETEFHISSIFKPFTKFIELKLKDKILAKSIAIELLKFCLNNKFIQKIAATKVYTNRIDNSRLENYINQRKKLFIDTSVGLFAMCIYYNNKNDYSNYFYRATKNLIDYSRKEKINLFISERYIWEIQNHIKDAYRLIPFTHIKNFTSLGSSRNVFYNFYNYLIQSKSIDDEISFSQFLTNYGFTENGSQDSFNSIIEHALSQINISKQAILKDYEIDETNRLFEDAMTKHYKNKTSFARNCDSIMLEFLADKDVDVHPVEPVFLTWDKTFFETHTTYIKKFPSSQNWLMLTPNKIVDIYALLKFSINSETVTENLLALISDDIITNTHSLVDTLAYILNPNDEIGLEYTSRLAKIREKEINQINNSEFIQPENFEGEAVIDDIFFNLTNHYKDNLNKLEDFKTVFTKKEFMEDVIKILVDAIKEFYINKKLNNSIYNDFDTIIKAANEDKNS